MNNDTIGVDVSKDHLDAHRLADGASRRFANDKCGRKAFVKGFAQTPVQRLVFEPTSPKPRLRARRAFPSSRSIPVRPAAAPRRSASWPRPIVWMGRCWRAWAQC
jgi:hypothetical protein